MPTTVRIPRRRSQLWKRHAGRLPVAEAWPLTIAAAVAERGVRLAERRLPRRWT
jgi:hypothetical protein